MADKKRIVILGGGYGGVEAAKHLHKEFRKKSDVEITLIDKNPYHTLMTELHEVAGSRVEEDSVKVPLRKIFGGKKINVVIDTVKTVDFESRKIVSDFSTYEYDYLVLGTGAEPECFGIPGVEENSFTLWSLEDALKLREHIQTMFLEASREPDVEKRKEMLTFVVAGGGFTGIEMVGELLEWKPQLCLNHGIDEEEVRIVVIEALPKILPILPDKLIEKSTRYLKKKGAELHLSSPITGASEGSFTIKDGTTFKTKTLIWTCGVQGGQFAANLALTKGKCTNRKCKFATTEGTCGLKDCQFADNQWIEGKRGRLLANEYMQAVDYKNVYLVGDVIWFLENDKVIPQIVETALQTAAVAADNIVADIEGKQEKKSFKSNYHGFMVSLGSKYGVAHVGGMSMSGFFAMAVKHLINLHYLWGVAGVNQCWSYLRHEFLDIRQNKSIIGGHASYKVPVYWTVPLRMFLGAKWLYEGVKKVTEGWLNPGDGGIFNASPSAVHMPGVNFSGADAGSAASAAWEAGAEAGGQAAAAATDAVAAASGAATETTAQLAQTATEAVSAASGAATEAVAQTVQATSDAVTAASGAAAEAAGEAGSAIGTFFSTIFQVTDQPKQLMEAWGIYNWFAENILSISPSFAFIMQSVVVIAEIAIGLALITGTFTFLSALASIGLGIMFITSGWGNPELLWYLAAAVVMLGGAGRGFGMDYWIMPWLKKRWNGTTLAKRSYLYTGEPRKVKVGTVSQQSKQKVEQR